MITALQRVVGADLDCLVTRKPHTGSPQDDPIEPFRPHPCPPRYYLDDRDRTKHTTLWQVIEIPKGGRRRRTTTSHICCELRLYMRDDKASYTELIPFIPFQPRLIENPIGFTLCI